MTEYEAFKRATDGLDRAIDGVKIVAQHRSDSRDSWLQLAQTLEITKQALFHLAGDGTVKGKH